VRGPGCAAAADESGPQTALTVWADGAARAAGVLLLLVVLVVLGRIRRGAALVVLVRAAAVALGRVRRLLVVVAVLWLVGRLLLVLVLAARVLGLRGVCAAGAGAAVVVGRGFLLIGWLAGV
jgi:hypothetical protein